MVLGDRVSVMGAGRIEQAGSPRDSYFQPKNRHVAHFLGSLNALEGAFRDGSFHTRGGHLPCPAQADGLPEVFFRSDDAVMVPAVPRSLLSTVSHVQLLDERTRVYLHDVTPAIGRA